MNTDIEAILNELKGFYEDLKAERILLELHKNTDLADEDFIVENSGSFKRGFSRDVLKYKKHDEKKILLTLSRSGIYDTLPEFFFHQNEKNSFDSSFGTGRLKRKKEEKEARLFFSPIENELFTQSINIYKKEQSLLDNFYELKNDFVLNFWNLQKHKKNPYILKLAKLLPHCHKISGDLNLIQDCLEKVLELPVEIVKKFKPFSIKHQKRNNELTLGMNLVANSKKSNVLAPFLEFKIGLIDNKKLNKVHKNTDLSKFLELFYSYFLPLEFVIETSFFSNKNEEFILNEKNMPVMGISTKI